MVKVTALAAEFQSLPGVVRNAIIRIYSEAEHDQVVALVTSVAWAGRRSRCLMAVGVPVNFDGTNDWLITRGACSAAADSKIFLISAWVRTWRCRGCSTNIHH